LFFPFNKKPYHGLQREIDRRTPAGKPAGALPAMAQEPGMTGKGGTGNALECPAM